MTRTRRTAAATLLTLLASTFGVLGSAAPAHAAAPVVADDAVTAYAGTFVEVSPLDNDSDADGDELAVCRVADSKYKKILVLFIEGRVQLLTRQNTKPGTYTFTYYACDFETLVPGTITLTIRKAPKITAKALLGQPGKIKVSNPADFKILFVYGSFREDKPDGQVKIAKQSSVILPVRRTRIDWIAISRKNGFTVVGHIKNIKLHKGTAPPTTGRNLSPRLARLWHD